MDDIDLLVQSRIPIIYIVTSDFISISNNICSLANSINANIRFFREGFGELPINGKGNANPQNLESFLDFQDGFIHEDIINEPKQNFWILHNIHDSLKDPIIKAQLVTIAEKQLYEKKYEATIFVVSSVLYVPKELESFVTILRPQPPSLEEISNKISSEDFSTYHIQKDDFDRLSLELKGLSWEQIKEILNRSFCNGGYISYEKDRKNIVNEKKQIIEKSGLLEYINTDEDINSIGGLNVLVDWLRKKSLIFNNLAEALKMGVDTPKGVLILGVPGCGKSLTAKATANIFNVPLVRLDVGRLLGKYIGESEQNMKNALAAAETISPCVLWIDEIEKAFSGGVRNGHEVTVRLIGQFLTWMQEKRTTVFVVATSNDIKDLPPEFLRKGRFDEIFSVGLPSKTERYEIFKIHLEKRKQNYSHIDFGELLKNTENFSGAEIKSVVSEALEEAFLDNRNCLETSDLIKVSKEIKPLAKIRDKDIKEAEEKLKSLQIKSASDENYIPKTYSKRAQNNNNRKTVEEVFLNYKQSEEKILANKEKVRTESKSESKIDDIPIKEKSLFGIGSFSEAFSNDSVDKAIRALKHNQTVVEKSSSLKKRRESWWSEFD